MKRITVYCGSRVGNLENYKIDTKKLAFNMVKNNIELVYGGGNCGLMGVISDEVLKLGGKVTGVITEKLLELEVGHKGLTEIKVVKTMHERKSIMEELADGFIALPGGIGTLEEIMEICTWKQIGYIDKPCGILNIDNYYENFIKFLDYMVERDFYSKSEKSELIIEKNPNLLIDKLRNSQK